MPLKPDGENKNRDKIKDDAENHNAELSVVTAEPQQFLPPAHLNGSVKLSVSETVEVEQKKSKIENTILDLSPDDHPPHSLWKFPGDRGKFTQVSRIVCIFFRS